MFGKKKSAVTKTFEDDIVIDLSEELLNARLDLRGQVKIVMVRNGVIDLYPDGADKDKAKKDAESAKNLLLCMIGRYDDLRNRYNDALEKHPNRVFTAGWARTNKTSHDFIEDFYKEFYERG